MFDAAIAAAGAQSPMASGAVPVLRSRILLVDGDGLAYYCAGNDEVPAGDARVNLVHKVRSAARIAGCVTIKVLLTSSGSNKGHRYAIARRKPYQGQRAGSRRPKNWTALRDYMDSLGFPFEAESTAVAEADDLFGLYAYNNPDDVVIYTQDKDMRMLPGMHLDWVTHRMHKVHIDSQLYDPPRVVGSVFNEKQYGHEWFWSQMLHGDTADNIPGLPKYKTKDAKGNEVFKPMGEVTAKKYLNDCTLADLPEAVADLYRGYYGDRWLVEMMEQACLLWMRRVPSRWDDCLDPGGPLACFNDGEHEFAKAYLEIKGRVTDADNINTATAEVNADSICEGGARC